MSHSSPVSRRTLFSLAGGSLFAAQMPVSLDSGLSTPAATSTTMVFGAARQGGPVLHVAGPRDGALADLARWLLTPMAAGLRDSGRLSLVYGGGTDGVTIANQFDARVAPDGQNALLFPGSVALTWLAGQGQVRLNPAQMLPLMAALGPGVLMVRGSLSEVTSDGRTVRLAAGVSRNAALTALLGLDLQGIPVRLVAPGMTPEQAARGESSGRRGKDEVADAVFLHGPTAAVQTSRLAAAGWVQAFTTGTGLGVSPASRPTPHFLAGVAPARLAGDPLVEAWRSAAAASALCAALVLPRLSPAASIGRWRRAARLGMNNGPVADHARRQALILVADNEASAALSPMRADAATQHALHRWMAGHALLTTL